MSIVTGAGYPMFSITDNRKVPMTRSDVLNEEEFGRIVRCAPLVSIDLIIRDPERKVLLGLRNHEPAKGYYFVPGGRIRKGELLEEAFSRILAAETGCRADFESARSIRSTAFANGWMRSISNQCVAYTNSPKPISRADIPFFAPVTE
jgi:8-oxo-dGTP pyrophosphatase MutT (NUDIX family)